MNAWSRRRMLVAAAATLAAPQVLRAAPLQLRVGHGLPTSHPVHPSIQHFAEIVREKTGGAIEIAIFPDGQIGQETNLLAQVRAGKLDLLKVSASVLEQTAPAYRVLNLPFLFRDEAHWRRVTTGAVGEQLLASSASVGLIGLSFFEAGSRSFYGKRPIHHPDDLKGLKVRIQPSPTTRRMVSLLGAEPVELDWDKVYPALKFGLVDAAENSVVALIVGRHAEVISHYAFNEHTMVPDVFVMSAVRWQGLSVRHQAVFREAALASYHRMNELWAVFAADARRASAAMGVSFSHPDKTPFVAAARPLREAFATEPDLADLINRIDQS